MENYLCARGTVVNGLPTSTPGIYSVAGLESKKGDYPLLIDAITFDKKDSLLAVACLNNVKVVYSFGEAFGDVVVRGTLLLGPLTSNVGTRHLQSLIDWFQANRVSASKAPVKMSIARQGAIRAYLNALRIAEPNPQFHTQAFVIGGVLVE